MCPPRSLRPSTTAQAALSAELVAVAPCRPATHTVHADVPAASALYAPVTHAVHAVDVDAVAKLPYVPTAQVEQEFWLLPLSAVGQWVPAMQLEQVGLARQNWPWAQMQ